MLRTNSKKVKENLNNYIINNTLDNDYNPLTTIENAKQNIRNEFYEEMVKYDNRYKVHRISHYELFKEWLQGLPIGGLGDYYYNVSAVDLVGDLLEETEEERNNYTEEQAEELMTKLLYKALY